MHASRIIPRRGDVSVNDETDSWGDQWIDDSRIDD
jgi:hypothetical protein